VETDMARMASSKGDKSMIEQKAPSLPFKTVRGIMKNCDGGRVSVRAVQLMNDYLIEYIEKITSEAILLRTHFRRSTLLASDIELARRRLQ